MYVYYVLFPVRPPRICLTKLLSSSGSSLLKSSITVCICSLRPSEIDVVMRSLNRFVIGLKITPVRCRINRVWSNCTCIFLLRIILQCWMMLFYPSISKILPKLNNSEIMKFHFERCYVYSQLSIYNSVFQRSNNFAIPLQCHQFQQKIIFELTSKYISHI